MDNASLIMGHHRLSIIDLTPGGHQPMISDDGRYAIVFNGEIFNYIELREELRTKGWKFKTESDTEVFLKSFIESGCSCFNHLNGMWAAAIYDRERHTIILTRDRFGIKPLYYAIIGESLFFASEAKFFLPFLRKKTINQAAVADYVVNCFLDHKEETMFSEIFQVMPGEYKIYDGHTIKGEEYWIFQPSENSSKNWTDALDEMKFLFESSIDLRLRSDVPIGSLLSGGLDSNTIVCNIHQRHKDGIQDFHLFSAVYNEEKFSERKYIEQTLSKTDFVQHWIYPDPSIIPQEISRIIYHMDFPVRSLQIYSQWTIMKNVRHLSPVIVLLNGQGSDEIFGGYTLDYYALFMELFFDHRFLEFFRESRILHKMRNISWYQILSSVIYQMSVLKNSRMGKPIKSSCPVLNKHWGYSVSAHPYDNERPFMRHLFNALKYSALPEYLRYEDRNSMAYSLETRLPFMDYRIVEWAFTLPAFCKIHGGINKRVLREYAARFVPESIVGRKDKQGFVTPQEVWQKNILREPMRKTLLDMDWKSAFPFIDAEACRKFINEYYDDKNNDWALVWRLYCLLIWHRLWFT